MNVVSRGIKNAFRNSIRTFSIVIILGLSIGLALAMLIAHQAVGEKISSVESSVGNTVSISPAGVRGFSGGGNPLTETQIAGVQKLAHITSVDESLSDRLTTSNSNLVSAVDAGTLGQRFAGNSGQSFTPPPDSVGGGSRSGGTSTFTPPVTVNGTTNPTNLSTTQGGGTFKLTSGEVFSSTSSDNVAVIGSSLATKNSLNVGSTFTAYSTTITVVGIFDAGNTFSNNQVIMPLKTVQTLSSQADDITSATANVDLITNVDSATTAIKSALGSAADVTNAAAQAQTTIAPLKNIQTISLYSLLGAVVAGAAIILLTMLMIVRERRREIGVLKAIGSTNVNVMLQFMTESITLTLLGMVVGVAIGALASNPLTQLLVTNSSGSTVGSGGGFADRAGAGAARFFGQTGSNLRNIQATVGWQILLYGVAAALIIAIIGSAIPALFISRVRPAEVMRAE